jgi:hypothetical protein
MHRLVIIYVCLIARVARVAVRETDQNSVIGRNEQQIDVRDCLLSFGVESFVFQFAIQKCKD